MRKSTPGHVYIDFLIAANVGVRFTGGYSLSKLLKMIKKTFHWFTRNNLFTSKINAMEFVESKLVFKEVPKRKLAGMKSG